MAKTKFDIEEIRKAKELQIQDENPTTNVYMKLVIAHSQKFCLIIGIHSFQYYFQGNYRCNRPCNRDVCHLITWNKSSPLPSLWQKRSYRIEL